MADKKRKYNKIETTAYVKKSEDQARLEQLIKQSENRSFNEE